MTGIELVLTIGRRGMHEGPSEEDVRQVIGAIEGGRSLVTKDSPWFQWSNLIVFTTYDRWRFVVFNDFGQWDYIERVIAPSGAMLEVDDSTPWLQEYHPRTMEAARRWGLSEEEAALMIRSSVV